MAAKKAPGKAATHKAGQVLSNPKASKAARSEAASILARAGTAKRKVKSPPKTGTVSRSAVRKAVAKVSSSRKNK